MIATQTEKKPQENTSMPSFAKETVGIIIYNQVRATSDLSAGSRYVEIFFNDTQGDLWEHRRFKEHSTTESVLLCIQNPDMSFRKIEIPEQIGTSLLEYLSKGQPREVFDCEGFVHYLNGCVNNFDRLGLHRGNYSKAVISTSELKPWNTIGMQGILIDIQAYLHFAFYIGNDLFLSKASIDGALIVTDLESMKREYDAPDVFLIDVEKLRSSAT